MAQNLRPDEILEKQFNIDFKGYNALEVDSFLDLVMQDYDYFLDLIRKQQELLERYEETLAKQKNLIRDYESRVKSTPDVSQSGNQVDVLRRLSRLEDAVFKQ